jgi:hypothetical protein
MNGVGSSRGSCPWLRQSQTSGLGFALAVATQLAVFPLFGVTISVTDNLLIGSIFTGISLLRSFALRRVFEALRM